MGIEFVSMADSRDRGSGWGAACYVPGGEVTAEEASRGFGHLPRPAVYSPLVDYSPPPPPATAAAAGGGTRTGKL